MGVDLFFILSGFLITGVLLDARDLGISQYFARFYARRARRILVPYVVFISIATAFVGTAWLRHWYFYIFLTNFLLPLAIPHPSSFDPLWSLAVEEQFYLVWPFAVYFLKQKHLKKFCLFLIVLAPALRCAFHFSNHWAVYTLTPFRMDLLAAGALLSLEWREHHATVQKWGARLGIPLSGLGIALLLALGKLGYTTYQNSRLGNVLIYEACLAVCLGLMLFSLGGRGVKYLESSPLTYIGKVSYSMYLVHAGVLVFVFDRMQGLAAVAVAFVITVAYATLSWYTVERPLLQR